MCEAEAHVEIRLSRAIAGLLDVPYQTVRVPLPQGQVCPLRQVLLAVEERAPGALLESRSGQVRRHIHVYLNGRPVADHEQDVRSGDVIEVDLRMLEGG